MRLARSDPSYTSGGAVDTTSNIRLNRAQLQAGQALEAVVGDYSVTNVKLGDKSVSQRVIDDSALVSRHFPSSLLLNTILYAVFKARDGSVKSDGDVTFYASASSGGAVTQLNTLTFTDGLLTGWTQA